MSVTSQFDKVPKVSVIVPIYNVEPYLRRCLNSLVNQTLKDIEIICINDCSPDNSLTVVREYADKDERIKIIDFKKNQGVSVARNAGLKIAKGDYIGFCDPDDYVDLDFYEKLYKSAKDKDADIAKASSKMMEIGSKAEIINVDINNKISKNKFNFNCHFWTAIYRNKMLRKHKIKFPPNVMPNEVIYFQIHAVIVAETICLLNNTFYHYIRRDFSLYSKTNDKKKAYAELRGWILILNLLNRSIQNGKITKLHYNALYGVYLYNILYRLDKYFEFDFVKKTAKVAIKYFQECKFQKSLNTLEKLPGYIVKTLKEKNEKKLVFLLQEWKENGFYFKINIKESALQNRKLYVWGAGVEGSKVLMQCKKNGWKILSFLDSNKAIKEFCGYKVKRPEQILSRAKKDFFIIISSQKYGKEIAKVCMKAGLKRDVDFWRPS